MKHHEMKTGKIIVPQAGGAIFINDDAGALVTEVGMTPGMHEASQFMFLMEPGWNIDATEGITLFVPAANRIQRMPYGPGATDTAAKPDFQPSSADQQMRRLQQQVANLTRRAERTEQREKEATRMRAEKEAKEAERVAREEQERAEKEEADRQKIEAQKQQAAE